MTLIRFDFRTKTMPLEHQLDGIHFLEGEKSRALFDEQGLGKSFTTISAICNDMKMGLVDSALIICKKSLIKTWENEIETHTNLGCSVISGDRTQRKKLLLTFAHFYIIGYESVISELEFLSEFLTLRKFAMILDESHKIKNPDSKVAKTILGIRNLAVKRIILSGTPVANKPEDLWAQFYFLDNGRTLGEDFAAFKKDYSIKISMGKQKIDPEKLEDLKEAIGTISMRRLKNNVIVLPEKRFEEVYIPLSGKQKQLYTRLRDELRLEIARMDGTVVIDESEGILKKLLRLTQIASNPKLLDIRYKETPAKFIVLDRLICDLMRKGEKVIIWTSFVDNIRILKKRYLDYGALTISGFMKLSERNRAVQLFQKDSRYRILIANPAAAREGLTLTAANNAIYLDRNFNLVDYLQSQDRIHRISQKKECRIIKLIARETVDEYIDEILVKKHNIAAFIQTDIKEIPTGEHLTKDYIMQILGG